MSKKWVDLGISKIVRLSKKYEYQLQAKYRLFQLLSDLGISGTKSLAQESWSKYAGVLTVPIVSDAW